MASLNLPPIVRAAQQDTTRSAALAYAAAWFERHSAGRQASGIEKLDAVSAPTSGRADDPLVDIR